MLCYLLETKVSQALSKPSMSGPRRMLQERMDHWAVIQVCQPLGQAPGGKPICVKGRGRETVKIVFKAMNWGP